MIDIDSTDDIEALRSTCRAYEHSNQILARKIESLARRLAELEGVDAAQAALDLGSVTLEVGAETESREAEKPSSARPRKTQRGHGPTPQPDLPRTTQIFAFAGSPDCPSCGGEMDEWKGQFEESEEITVVETRFSVRLARRQKYRCRCNGAVITAPGPPKLIPGGRYSLDFAVHSAVAKFCDHLPLERQVRQAARQGLEVTSQTLWDQHAGLAKHLEPTWELLWQTALNESVLHVDETGWRMMGSKRKPKWTLFGLTTPGLAVYHLMSSKSTAAAQDILAGFRGTLVVDGYQVYPIVAQLEKTIRIAHCWAHADRKFKDAKDPPAAIAKIRKLIANLYEIERQIEGSFPGSPENQSLRLRLRQEKCRPIVRELRKLAMNQGGLRRSAFGKALRYLLKHWNGLTLFLEDPAIPLDNNAAERALRGPVVGRKNFYGNRSPRGAKVAAILYSMIETAKLNGADPSEYLRDTAEAAIERPGPQPLPFV